MPKITVSVAPALAAFNVAAAGDVREQLLGATAAPRWAEALVDDRPYPSLAALLSRSDELLARADEDQLDAALAGHPRIGERARAERSDDEPVNDKPVNNEPVNDEPVNDEPVNDEPVSDEAAARSAREQAGMDSADAAQKQALAEANAAYEARFGRIYLVAAAGLSAADLLAKVQARLHNDPGAELDVVRAELAMITRSRLTELLS